MAKQLDEGLFDEEIIEDEIIEEPKKAKSKVPSIGMDDIEDEDEETPILDLVQEEREIAQKKINSGEMLFPEEEEALKKFKKKSKRVKGEKKERAPKTPRVVHEVEGSIILAVSDAMVNFDPETANKKEIRTLRKALQGLSLARYPKKQKDRKKFPKKVEEAEPVVRKVIKKKT